MTYQKNKKEKLTSSFIGLKLLAFMMLAMTSLLFIIFWTVQTIEIAISALMFGMIGLIIWIYTKTRNSVYYGSKKFYIFNWKGMEINIVSNEMITSMLFSGFGGNSFGSAYRVFYLREDGTKKDFWIFPNLRTNVWVIREKLKELNPDLLTTNFSFGGIEHLFVKDEDWFR